MSLSLFFSVRALSQRTANIQITHGTTTVVDSFCTRSLREYRVTQYDLTRARLPLLRRVASRSRLSAQDHTGGGRARSHVSRSTRPNVAGADSGVNRWRREHPTLAPSPTRRPPTDPTDGRTDGICGASAHNTSTRRARAPERDALRRPEYHEIGIHTYARAPKSRADDSYTPPNL